MSTPGIWSAGQRALLRFVEREGFLAAPVDPPTDAPVSDDALFALLDTVLEQTTLAKRLAERLRLPLLEGDELGTDAGAADLLKADVAQRCGVVVLSADDRTIEVASANPLDLDAVKTVEFAAGRRARVSVATRTAVQRGLARLYGGDTEAVATQSPEEPVAATLIEASDPAPPAATGEVVWTLEETDDPLLDAAIADDPVVEPPIAEPPVAEFQYAEPAISESLVAEVELAAPAPEVVDTLPSEPLLSEIAAEPVWTVADDAIAAPSPAAEDDVTALLALLEAPAPPIVEETPVDEPAVLTSDAAIELAISALLVDSPPVAASNGAATDTVWSVLEELLVPEPIQAAPADDSAPTAEEPQPAVAFAAQLAPLETRLATLGTTIDQVRRETVPRLNTLEETAEHWSRVAAECLAIPRLQDGVITAQHAIADLRTAVGQLRDEAVRHATAADHGLGHRLEALAGELSAAGRATVSRLDALEAATAALRGTPDAIAELRRMALEFGEEMRRPAAPVEVMVDPRTDALAAESAALARDTAARFERLEATIGGLAAVRDAVVAVPGTVAGLQHQLADVRERAQVAEHRLAERLEALAADHQRWREEAASCATTVDTPITDGPDEAIAAIGMDVARLRQELERTADDVHRLSVAAAAQIAGAEDRAVAVERMRAELQQLRDEAGRRGETFETRLASRVDDVVKALKAESLIARDAMAEQLTRIEGRIGALEADAQATRAERQGTQGTVELALAEIHSELSALHQRRNGRAPATGAEDPQAALPWLVSRVRSQLSSELTTLGRLGGVIVQLVRSVTPTR